ncbi:MAG: uroporphyrinogen decarboxylase family protein [Thermomicrobiales bacterium]
MANTAQMTSRERVLAALNAQEVDRPPVSLWQHYPERDQSAAALGESTRWWQGLLNLDFIKLMPPGDYATIDWGLTSEFRGAKGGTRDTTLYPVQSVEDWSKIVPVRATAGFNGEMVVACGLVRDILGPDVPLLQTVFSPLTIANKLSDGRVIDHLRSNPELMHQTLGIIRDVTVEVTKASIAAGASGVFFASQCATTDMLTREEYDEFGVPYDLPVVEAANGAGSEFTLIHIHGANTFFDLLAGYPGHAINWHDRRIGPDIPSALANAPERAAVAGIDEHGIAVASPRAVRNQVRQARDAAQDRHLLVGPGCVIAVATPMENLQAAVAAAREPHTWETDMDNQDEERQLGWFNV